MHTSVDSENATATKQRSRDHLCSKLAAIVAAFYFVASLYIAFRRLFWFDEILTVTIARLQGIPIIWTSLIQACDGLPPGYYCIVRVFEKIFGHSEMAARLPSALGMAVGLFIIFDCARRMTDGLHGLVALTVLTCSFLPFYGFEARSYAIYFMLSALSLWCWCCTPDDRAWPAVLFGLVLFSAVATHYYAVLLIVPYALWQISQWKAWQNSSRKVIAGFIGILVPIALLSKAMSAFSHDFSRDYWARPSFHELRALFSSGLLPDGPLLLVLVTIWIVLAVRKRRTMELQPMRPGESVSWLFLCIPLAGFALAELKTNAFLPRYFIGVLPGIAVGIACALWRLFRNSHIVSAGIVLFLTFWGIAGEVIVIRHPDSIGRNVDPTQHSQTRQFLSLEGRLRSEGKHFFLFPSESGQTAHLPAAYYSKYPNNCVLLVASDVRRVPMPARLELRLARYYPLQFWTIDDLQAHASDTALINPSAETLTTIRQAGFTPSIRFTAPMTVVYLRE